MWSNRHRTWYIVYVWSSLCLCQNRVTAMNSIRHGFVFCLSITQLIQDRVWETAIGNTGKYSTNTTGWNRYPILPLKWIMFRMILDIQSSLTFYVIPNVHSCSKICFEVGSVNLVNRFNWIVPKVSLKKVCTSVPQSPTLTITITQDPYDIPNSLPLH